MPTNRVYEVLEAKSGEIHMPPKSGQTSSEHGRIELAEAKLAKPGRVGAGAGRARTGRGAEGRTRLGRSGEDAAGTELTGARPGRGGEDAAKHGGKKKLIGGSFGILRNILF
jgi:hypothetical protein